MNCIREKNVYMYIVSFSITLSNNTGDKHVTCNGLETTKMADKIVDWR